MSLLEGTVKEAIAGLALHIKHLQLALISKAHLHLSAHFIKNTNYYKPFIISLQSKGVTAVTPLLQYYCFCMNYHSSSCRNNNIEVNLL